MPAKPDANVRSFASEALIRQMAVIRNELDNVRTSQDIEAIHRTRVASRRLRTLLPLFEDYLPKKSAADWQARFRKLRRALGAARDSDVQLERLEKFMAELPQPRYRAGVQRLMLRIRQNRVDNQTQVLKAIKELESSKMLESALVKLTAISNKCEKPCPYSAELYRLAHDSILKQLDDLFAHEPALNQEENTEALHAMRVEAKYMRYTMETFAPLYPDSLKTPIQKIRNAQELLGEIHDSDVWLAYLPDYLATETQQTLGYYGHTRPMSRLNPGIHYFQQCLIENRQDYTRQFLKAWQDWKEEGVWTDLKETIERPVLLSQSPFPPPESATSAPPAAG